MSYHDIWDAVNSCFQQQRQAEHDRETENKTRDYQCCAISNLQSKWFLDIYFPDQFLCKSHVRRDMQTVIESQSELKFFLIKTVPVARHITRDL